MNRNVANGFSKAIPVPPPSIAVTQCHRRENSQAESSSEASRQSQQGVSSDELRMTTHVTALRRCRLSAVVG
jgi:hypothetical protein